MVNANMHKLSVHQSNASYTIHTKEIKHKGQEYNGLDFAHGPG
jgi:hypothetical protein